MILKFLRNFKIISGFAVPSSQFAVGSHSNWLIPYSATDGFFRIAVINVPNNPTTTPGKQMKKMRIKIIASATFSPCVGVRGIRGSIYTALQISSPTKIIIMIPAHIPASIA